MTDPPIEQLDLLDTDYADILASSNYPALELQLWYQKNRRRYPNHLALPSYSSHRE
jgi:hypothetical protein